MLRELYSPSLLAAMALEEQLRGGCPSCRAGLGLFVSDRLREGHRVAWRFSCNSSGEGFARPDGGISVGLVSGCMDLARRIYASMAESASRTAREQWAAGQADD